MDAYSEHVAYPHEPGTLYDCNACEDHCNCDGVEGHTMCLHCANQWDDLLANSIH